MVDIADLKSAGGDSVPVRVRLAAPPGRPRSQCAPGLFSFSGGCPVTMQYLNVAQVHFVDGNSEFNRAECPFLFQNAGNCIGRIDLSISDLLEERVMVDD